jgi:uncharacterized protein YutE (UPF0331/DUF86 family)
MLIHQFVNFFILYLVIDNNALIEIIKNNNKKYEDVMKNIKNSSNLNLFSFT